MKKILLVFLAISALWGCNPDEVVPPKGPVSLSVKDSIHCDWQGTPRGVFVATNQDTWTATIDEAYKEWCDFIPRRDSIVVKLRENTSQDPREGKIVIHAGNLTDTLLVVQEGGALPSLSISTNALDFVWQENTMTVDVTTNQTSWSGVFTAPVPTWCKLKQVDSQLFVETLNNDVSGERTAMITITAGIAEPMTINVRQAPKSAAVSGTLQIELPTSFDASKVYAVWNGDKKIAELCSEYVSQISTDKRSVVIYPVINNKPDLKNGFVADGGGKLSWTDAKTYVYTPGGLTVSGIYITEDGTISANGSSSQKATVVSMFLKDAEGYKYGIVKVGGNFWLVENLRTKTFSDGTPIGQSLSSTKGFWWKYTDQSTYVDDACGLLYGWHTTKNIAPTGWHVPSRAEWENMMSYLGVEHSLYVKNHTGWSESGNGNNLSGLSMLPGGTKLVYRDNCKGGIDNKLNQGGHYGTFWSTSEELSDEGDEMFGNSLYVENVKKTIVIEKKEKAIGMSIRLLRDI